MPISNLKIVPHFMCICVTFKKLAKKRIQVEAILTKCVSGFSFLCTSDDVDMVYSSNHYASFIQPSVNFIHVVYYRTHLQHQKLQIYFSAISYILYCIRGRIECFNALQQYVKYFLSSVDMHPISAN